MSCNKWNDESENSERSLSIENLIKHSSEDLEDNNTADVDMDGKFIPCNSSPLKIETLSSSPTNKYIEARTFGESTLAVQSNSNRRSTQIERIFEIQGTDEGVIDTHNTYSYANFLKAHTCYDCVPNSSKLVVVDTKIKVKKAFFALVHNNIRSAPVWDSDCQEFVGMLTITDFISILIRYYKSPLQKMWELEEHKIETWRNLFKANLPSTLQRISPTESIYAAVQMLVRNKIHRLPVIDPLTGNALFILTHKKVLSFIYQRIDDLAMPDYLGCSLRQLGIGSFRDVLMIYPWTTVIEALNLFASKGVSALPIVDHDKKCVDIYSKFDVINLAAERTYNNLDVTVQEALRHRQEGFEGVHKCLPCETLYVIIDRIVTAKVHRLVVVDENDHVLGVVSLSDILRFIVLDPPKDIFL